MKDKNTKLIVGLVSIVLVVCVCAAMIVTASILLAGESLASIPTLSPPTVAALPTAALANSDPTSPPAPTAAPTIVDTPLPTSPPLPTSSPTAALPPAPPPDPIVFSGQGDSIIDAIIPDAGGLLHIIGNAESRHFAVENYSASGETIDLLVNTTDPYDGYRPIDWLVDQKTTRFKISATGPWEITYYPFALYSHSLTVPGEYTGNGDDVIALLGSQSDIATVSANPDARHFAIIAYADSTELLVNTTDPYQGSVLVPPGTLFLEVIAVGPWTIQITAK